MHDRNQQFISRNELPTQSEVETQQWIVGRLADELHVGRNKIAIDEAILSLGIDSVQIVSIMTQLEDWAGVRFEGNPLEDCSTIAELARQVEDLRQKIPVKPGEPG